jgi:hypothetical protein
MEHIKFIKKAELVEIQRARSALLDLRQYDKINYLQKGKPMKDNNEGKKTKGRCLCGQVQFEIYGELRDIVNCHCSKCRKFHGNYGAYTSIKFDNLKITQAKSLKWYKSPTDETANVHRGFCSECGSSLFWHPKGQTNISKAAGSLDEPTGLKTIGHIWCSQLPDYYQIDDNIPKFDERWDTVTDK